MRDEVPGNTSRLSVFSNGYSVVRERAKQPCVYILSSRRNGTLYIGVTSSIADRMYLHTNDLLPGFTSRYGVKCLVYYEMHETMEQAILREKRLKKWSRLWKVRLIEEMNPEWRPLFDQTKGLLDHSTGGQCHPPNQRSAVRGLSRVPPSRE
ncbi:MAG: GIY-YIG nuclease family protein [Pseudomonadota bacterium]